MRMRFSAKYLSAPGWKATDGFTAAWFEERDRGRLRGCGDEVCLPLEGLDDVVGDLFAHPVGGEQQGPVRKARGLGVRPGKVRAGITPLQ